MTPVIEEGGSKDSVYSDFTSGQPTQDSVREDVMEWLRESSCIRKGYTPPCCMPWHCLWFRFRVLSVRKAKKIDNFSTIVILNKELKRRKKIVKRLHNETQMLVQLTYITMLSKLTRVSLIASLSLQSLHICSQCYVLVSRAYPTFVANVLSQAWQASKAKLYFSIDLQMFM